MYKYIILTLAIIFINIQARDFIINNNSKYGLKIGTQENDPSPIEIISYTTGIKKNINTVSGPIVITTFEQASPNKVTLSVNPDSTDLWISNNGNGISAVATKEQRIVKSSRKAKKTTDKELEEGDTETEEEAVKK